MNENRTIGTLLLIIVILGLALVIKIFFFSNTNSIKVEGDQGGTAMHSTQNMGNTTNKSNKTTKAESAIANKTSGYVDSVQKEKENHKELENTWDSYTN